MGLQVYTLNDSKEWDEIVCTFHDFDVYWLSGYVKAFVLHGDGEPLLFYYEDDFSRGINVVMKRDIAKNKYFKDVLEQDRYFDFATPYGYGGWIVEGEDATNLFQAYDLWCMKNGIISEFVRFHPVLENHLRSTNIYEVIPLGKTITMDLESPEIIWENFTSKNRNMIRKAQKNGVSIFSGRYPEIYKEFQYIYNETMDKDNADEYYYFEDSFYKSLLNDLKYNAQVFYAVYESQVIAAAIMIFANGRMNYHLSGSLKAYSGLAPTNLMLYEAAMWGYANGYKTLYLGGGVGSGEDNLYKFKSAFYRKGDLRTFFIGKKIYLQDKYNELVEKRNKIENTSYFPLYRA